MQDFLLETTFLDNSARAWLIALGVAAAETVAGLYILARLLAGRLRQWADNTNVRFDNALVELVASTKIWFIAAMGLWAGSASLHFEPTVRNIITSAGMIVLLAQCAVWVGATINFVVAEHRKDHIEDAPGSVSAVRIMAFIARLIAWSMLTLLALDNVGVDVTALVAGLGVGGIAVALALQNILGDLFASLSIVIDKPFVVGDFLVIGDELGSVERIGIKTTRLRSLRGEEIVVANSDLLTSRIRNFKTLEERRMVLELGVLYETPTAKLRRIPDYLREAVEGAPQTRFDRAHLVGFGDSAVTFELVYYVLSGDYTIAMDVQQAVNLSIIEAFQEDDIDFAYPTRRLYVSAAEETMSVSVEDLRGNGRAPAQEHAGHA